jgi:hypothetical protein
VIGALLPGVIRKEVRALLPVWLACAAAIVAALLWEYGGHRGRILAPFPILAYILGSVALGALSMGHEYTGRTLALLLSQPIDRRRLYVLKLAVLISMLLTLAALAYGLVFPVSLERANSAPRAIPLLSVLCALFLAPWLTMICRGPLPGVVFTLAVVGVIHIVADGAGASAHGFGPDAERLRLAVFWWGLSGVCVVAAISSWRMFMRLEAIEGGGSQVQLPGWPVARARADVEQRRNPVWLLAKKELRLQQLTFAVSGVYLLEWGVLWLLRSTTTDFEGIPFAVLTAFHSGAAAFLSGSAASADERQIGTLESQVLLPMATWKQWAVKAGMAIGVVLLLGAALPAVLGPFSPSGDGLRISGWHVGALTLLAVASLWISSLCASGMQALLVSASLVMIAPLFRLLHSMMPARPSALFESFSSPALTIAIGAVLLLLLLRFGLVNHRSSDRSFRRLWPQAASLSAWLLLAFVLLAR